MGRRNKEEGRRKMQKYVKLTRIKFRNKQKKKKKKKSNNKKNIRKILLCFF